MSKVIEEQLKKVTEADLSNFDATTNTYHIPQRKSIKIEEDNCYIIALKPQAFTNPINTNWNSNKAPIERYMKVEVSKIMPNMIKVVGVGYDIYNKTILNSFWSGWLQIDNIDILSKV